MNLPESYQIKMQKLLLDEYDNYNNSLLASRQYGLRLNSLKISQSDLFCLFDTHLKPVDWCADGFYYDPLTRPSKSPYYHAGLFYIQEPSAMSSAAALPVSPGDKVLDLCAAPGGKSTQLGARLQNTGVLVANDASASRAKGLLKNIELFGITNALVTVEPPVALRKKFPFYFDKILVDAPCSGEGMFRKDEDMIKAWRVDYSCKLSQIQRSILDNAKDMLADNGFLLYSTCTFAPEENEETILHFLQNNPDFSLVPLPEPMRSIFSASLPHYLPEAMRMDFERFHLSRCARLWPHKICGEGHFLALLQRNSNAPAPHTTWEKSKKAAASASLREGLPYYYAFVENFMYKAFGENFLLHGSSLYSIPHDFPNFDTLRVLRSGLYLGELKKGRFEPSQALAMALSPSMVKYTVPFTKAADSPLIARYLSGDSFDYDLPDCWALVCVDGYPLGWGKITAGRLKNKYHPGWRTC